MADQYSRWGAFGGGPPAPKKAPQENVGFNPTFQDGPNAGMQMNNAMDYDPVQGMQEQKTFAPQPMTQAPPQAAPQGFWGQMGNTLKTMSNRYQPEFERPANFYQPPSARMPAPREEFNMQRGMSERVPSGFGRMMGGGEQPRPSEGESYGGDSSYQSQTPQRQYRPPQSQQARGFGMQQRRPQPRQQMSMNRQQSGRSW